MRRTNMYLKKALSASQLGVVGTGSSHVAEAVGMREDPADEYRRKAEECRLQAGKAMATMITRLG
jgi:hypothetical protein